MLIDIRSGPSSSVDFGGIAGHRLNDGGSFFVLIRSPNHPEIPVDASMDFGVDLKSYTNYYVNDSICILDNDKRRLLIARDWPGNIMLYYWIGDIESGKCLVVSDDLEQIAAEIPDAKASKCGIKLFLTGYKHYHSQTIYEGVKILPQGFFLEFDLTNGSLVVKPWFEFHRHIVITNPKHAQKEFCNAVDASIQRIVSKEDKIALMFSGGSDSTLLLDRLIHLGYKNISLFNVETLGQVAQSHRAKVRAKTYGVELTCIQVHPEQACKDWLEVIGKIYSAPSDVRPNGWASEHPYIYRKLSEYYGKQPVNVMWGYARPFHGCYVRLKHIPFTFLAYALLRLLPATKGQRLNSIGRFCLRLLGKIEFVENNKSALDQMAGTEEVLVDFANEVKHPDELINLKLILGYIDVQEWELHRFQAVSNTYYPQARNVWPFYDRCFQEVTMTMSLRARFGGVMNWLGMQRAESRKNLTVNAIEKELPETSSPAESLLGGNYYGQPSMKALYQHERCYCAINDLFSQPLAQRLLKYLSKEKMFEAPGSFDEFCELSLKKIEKLSGVVLLLAHFIPNRIQCP